MQDDLHPPRRRSRWPLFVMPGLLLVLAVGWSAFWFYASSQVSTQFDRWRTREAQSGRVYDCGKLTVGGYPFRFEVRCENASVNLISQTANRRFGQGRLPEILAVAQIYNPKLLIAEFEGPLTVTEQGEQQSLTINWSKAQSSVYGLPVSPERIALVVDEPSLEAATASGRTPLGRAKQSELHGRIVEGSASANPVIEVAWQLMQASANALHPALSEAFDATVQARMSGLKDFRPKPWPERFREIQAENGRIEILQSRLQQGAMVAVATGSLGITPQGMLDGELQMVVAGLEKIVPALGLDRILEQGVPQETLDRLAPGLKAEQVDKAMGALDRLIPGLGNVVRQRAPAALGAGVAMLGQKTTLEGKSAQAFPLRFSDGAVFLGPIRLGQAPPLF
ncbi:DUF2125 domain-containing protein [Bradyrhizobium sp. LHD-71]|uniref:DUF2125 domain-containing protein n=1 Tax=Bradyrhizobium sp. LHD-71 TaxID=3072141 RepID=UPI00280C4199|nr:DUF2125 domain-containing protein [Bradyrhizobium sp. LHD-71]MDQ8730573.1 DUF2125 domain-containing protein [Bradyrhizobium sp. LHD-71]